MSGLFAQQNPWGASPQPVQGIGTFPGALQPQAFASLPFGNVTPTQFSGYGTPSAQPPLQQIVQSLLVVPQQLQHLLQLAQIQQQQVQYLLQAIPQQLQQLQQQLAHPGFQSFASQHTLGLPQIPFAGFQPFGAQPGYLM
jgi:hypothetical protein